MQIINWWPSWAELVRLGFPYLVSHAVEFSKTCDVCEEAHDVGWTCKCVSPANKKPMFSLVYFWNNRPHSVFGFVTLVTRRPYCPGRPKKLCYTTLSLAMETMGMRLSVVKQSFFGPPGQYGRLVTRVNGFLRVIIPRGTLGAMLWRRASYRPCPDANPLPYF